jgi:hypothetical protein
LGARTGSSRRTACTGSIAHPFENVKRPMVRGRQPGSRRSVRWRIATDHRDDGEPQADQERVRAGWVRRLGAGGALAGDHRDDVHLGRAGVRRSVGQGGAPRRSSDTCPSHERWSRIRRQMRDRAGICQHPVARHASPALGFGNGGTARLTNARVASECQEREEGVGVDGRRVVTTAAHDARGVTGSDRDLAEHATQSSIHDRARPPRRTSFAAGDDRTGPGSPRAEVLSSNIAISSPNVG